MGCLMAKNSDVKMNQCLTLSFWLIGVMSNTSVETDGDLIFDCLMRSITLPLMCLRYSA